METPITYTRHIERMALWLAGAERDISAVKGFTSIARRPLSALSQTSRPFEVTGGVLVSFSKPSHQMLSKG
ncbi:hypothetical protein WG906_08140 [Pedobacter sp. P351]|uniref:hypothetical protein n=1 Tax=Pedobacter superstes TaxID=3133441 RepID=UPI0030A7C17C